jgi:hypothetical protein
VLRMREQGGGACTATAKRYAKDYNTGPDTSAGGQGGPPYQAQAPSISILTHLYGALRSVVARQAKYASGFLGGANSCNTAQPSPTVSTYERLVL